MSLGVFVTKTGLPNPGSPCSDLFSLNCSSTYQCAVVLVVVVSFFGEALLTDLASAAWKERLAATEVAQTKIRGADPSTLSCQLAVRILMRKPGLKDNNFQVRHATASLLQLRKDGGGGGYTLPQFLVSTGVDSPHMHLAQLTTLNPARADVEGACWLNGEWRGVGGQRRT